MTADIITIEDRPTGSSARILTSLGFNLFELRLPVAGQVHDVLWAEEGFETGQKRPSGSGIPLLFPFPGRLRGTSLVWNDRSYELEAGDGRGNAIHGFVFNRPWRVIDQGPSYAVAEFQASQDAPQLLEMWPADFGVEVRYTLQHARLECCIRIWNPTRQAGSSKAGASDELPCGLGLHPYFRIPLGNGLPEDCMVQVPVTAEWPLEHMQPTGQRRALEDAERFAAGIPFPQMQLDHVFSGTQFNAEGLAVASIRDERQRGRVDLQFDSQFSECVVYTPPHREAICIEPYSCVPGAVQTSDPSQHGLWLLGPGQSLTTRWQIA